MKTLIIDNTLDVDSWGASNLCSFVTRSKERSAFVRRAPHDDLPGNILGYDRLILSGSRTSCLETGSWISNLDLLIRQALDAGKPILGICYGHQALNRVIGGAESLARSATGEFGWTEIEVIGDAPLFRGLPSRFFSFSSHFEEVTRLVPGMKRIASSPDCSIQACQMEGRPVYGIQFHPEKDLSSAEKTILAWKKGKSARWISRASESAKLYDPSVGEKIFENFFEEK
ncbi:MAG: gamma-glutamyl-gamma-aminobutyrate hydrolase family protein [Cryobacterium sp.]|nr:gamma-glutamyl-gamma-aminobutyrate hydrolase family protein [Oligoflexia bacterium]